MTDQIGRVLGGRYRLLAPLGSGASALVYLADDVRLRRRVAVKVLHAGLADDESFLRRFRAEAQAAAALNHPHIVAVYDWNGDEGTPFLVTEYLSGGSLRSLLDAGHRLTPSQALVVGLEAARALDHAHGQGFVHRDIKPANMLFGADARLRIADFGLARAIAEAHWTEPAGAVLGTARYASPEQARGEDVDGRSDVYSLALTLIEGVTGAVPFSADTTIGMLMARLDQELPVPEAMGPLRPVLEAAGRQDPAQRLDAAGLGRGLMAAAEELPRPRPLPITGMGAVAAAVGAHPGVLPAEGGVDPGNGRDGPGLPPGPSGDLAGPPDPAVGPGPHDPAGVGAAAGVGASLAAGADPHGAGGGVGPGGAAGPGANGHGWVPAGPLAPAGAVIPATGSVLVAAPPADDLDRTEIGVLPPGALGPGGPGAVGPYGPSGTGQYPLVPGGPSYPPGGGPGPAAGGRNTRRTLVTALAVLAALAIGAVGAVVILRTNVPSHTVPNGLIGRQYAELSELVGDYGWRIDVREERQDGTAEGEILDTHPAPGEQLKEGDTLTVVRSLGATLVDVPTDLVGLTQQEAEERLAAPGVELVAQVQPEPSEDVDEGDVIRLGDTPAQVAKGSPVVLVVSSGPPPRVVPDDIEGQPYDAVADELEDMGLTVEREVDPEADADPGTVVDSDPAPGEEVDRDDRVTLYVAPGDSVGVPNLSDLSVEDATEALEDVGLARGNVVGSENGTVFSTLPLPGSQLPPGAEVTLFAR
jgi:serine/threonine-protein kinase